MAPVRTRRTCYICGPTDKHLFSFPTGERFAAWRKFCDIDDVQKFPKTSKLCAEHFEKSLIISARNETKLFRTAVPTMKHRKIDTDLNTTDEIADRSEGKLLLKNVLQNRFKSLNVGQSLTSESLSKSAEDDSNMEAADFIPNESAVTPRPSLHESVGQMDDPAIMESTVANKSHSKDQTTPTSRDHVCNRFMDGPGIMKSTPATESHSENQTTPTSRGHERDGSIDDPVTMRSTTVNDALENSQTTPTTRGQGSSTRKRSLRYIQDIKTPDLETPRRRRECLSLIRYESKTVQGKMKTLKQQNVRLRKKLDNMKQLLFELQQKDMLTAQHVANLMRDLPPILSELALRRLCSTKQKYSAEIRKFALTVHFYSPQAYNYVRSKWAKLLPHPSTLRKWACTESFDPGFSLETLEYLKKRRENTNGPILCNLVLDEISIRRQLIIKNNKKYGCVDLGFGNTNTLSSDTVTSDSDESDGVSDEEKSKDADKLPPLAKNSLVFMLVALNSSWKVPIAYFLIDSLDGKERSQILERALQLTEEYNITVRSVTFDGAAVNHTMVKRMGANLDVLSPNFKPYFKHPATDENVYVFLDPCHMLKNVRNIFGKTLKKNKNGDICYESPMFDEKGQRISFAPIESVVYLQEDEGLRAGNKLRRRHINYRESIMNVKLAAQTLSASTAKTLRYLQKKKPKQFPMSGVPEFAEHFNNAFDILNCHSQYYNAGSKKKLNQYMKPLNVNTFDELHGKADRIIDYIKGLKNYQGNYVVESKQKCGFIGFIICLTNVFPLFQDLNTKYGLQYLLTKKLLQDHLENFFSCIRMRGGFNNNPNAHQFMCAYRLLVQHHQVKSSDSANCVSTEDVPILNVTSSHSIPDDFWKMKTNTKFKFNFSNIYIPSDFVKDVADYIGGFVIYKICKKDILPCKICTECIEDPFRISDLIDEHSEGYLRTPSEDLSKVFLKLESYLRENGDRIFSSSFLPSVIDQVQEEYLSASNTEMFGGVSHEIEHKRNILELACALYMKVRLFHEAEVISHIDKYIRRCYTKLILFNNQ